MPPEIRIPSPRQLCKVILEAASGFEPECGALQCPYSCVTLCQGVPRDLQIRGFTVLFSRPLACRKSRFERF
jgi:hypothetical protein